MKRTYASTLLVGVLALSKPPARNLITEIT